MFRDYWKLNKLNVIVLTILLGLIIILSALTILAASVDKQTYFWVNRITTFIPIVLLYGNVLMFGLFCLGLFATAIKTFVGRNRLFIMMQRGRNYYLRLQLLIASASALIIVILTTIVILILKLYFYTQTFELNYIPPFEVYSNGFTIIKPIIIGCIFILVYYFVMYLIGIFSNTSLRYQGVAKRNFAVVKFIVRTLLIGGLTFYIFISSENLRVLYESPYINLFTQKSPYINSTIALVIIVLVPILIVDYMLFFKKKVLV